MRVDQFDYDLPEDRIALRPAAPRDSARLLQVGPGGILADRRIADLPDLLRPGDLLLVNDSRVIPARLAGRRGRAAVEVTLLKAVASFAATLAAPVIPATPVIPAQAGIHAGDRPFGPGMGPRLRWTALARPAKRLKAGDEIDFAEGFAAQVAARGPEGEVTLDFAMDPVAFAAALRRHGRMPLPPYIERRRPIEAGDAADYQTLFAARDGAVAAPTAALHFTPGLVAALEARGVGLVKGTLHVGAGTFLPVKAADTADHVMHAEWGELSDLAARRIRDCRAAGGRLVAVGTTAARLAESAAAASPDGAVAAWIGETRLFITPGFRFRAVDRLLTNFHLPRSTLLMLVAAYAGLDRIQAAYAHAVKSGYRFYSYGDACLLAPAGDGEGEG